MCKSGRRSLSGSAGIIYWVVEYKLAVALPQGHTQSKISINARLPVFVQVVHTKICLEIDKDKDKEALFNVAYNVTDNISS